MKYVALSIVAGLTACSASAHGDEGQGIVGSGSGTNRTYAVTGFDRVELGGFDRVDVHVGPGFSIRAAGPQQELDRLRIVKDGDALRIGRRNGTSVRDSQPVTVSVTLPRLVAAALGGSGEMAIDRVEGPSFDVSLGGSGTMGIGALAVDNAKVSIGGSGNVRASGTARHLDVNIGGSGSMLAPRLSAREAQVSIAGSGNVTALVDGPAKVNMVGSGDVDLGPNAQCTVSKMGSGSVRCR